MSVSLKKIKDKAIGGNCQGFEECKKNESRQTKTTDWQISPRGSRIKNLSLLAIVVRETATVSTRQQGMVLCRTAWASRPRGRSTHSAPPLGINRLQLLGYNGSIYCKSVGVEFATMSPEIRVYYVRRSKSGKDKYDFTSL